MTQLALDIAVSPADALPTPIPAKCRKCGYNWVGRDAIVSPSLDCCRCFWCDGELRPHRGERDFAIEDRHAETRRVKAVEKHFRVVERRPWWW